MVKMSRYTTLKIGGPAKMFLEAKDEQSLKRAVADAVESGLPFLVIGSGSNLLVSDDGFEGLVIKNSVSGVSVRGKTVSVKSGAILQELVNTANRKGLSGIERLAGIPGTVAGAIYGNAGAYGQSMSDKLVRVKTFDGAKEFWLSKKECVFDYRESVFKKNKNWAILEAEFELERGDSKKLKKTSKETLALRRVKYPEGLKSPGSFFKNIFADNLAKSVLEKIPDEKIIYGKIPAGYLLEAVGAKGASRGGAQVSSHHGNLFLNQGDATAEDFYELAREYQKKVKDKFGIALEPEVQLVGFKKGL